MERCTSSVVASFAHDLARRLAEATQALAAARRALDEARPTNAAIELDRIEDRIALGSEIALDLLEAAGQPGERTITPRRARLAAVTSAWLDETRRTCSLAGVSVETGSIPDAHVELDGPKLERLLKHLVHRALAQPGGSLAIELATRPDGPGRTALAFSLRRSGPSGDSGPAGPIHEALARRLATLLGGSFEAQKDAGALLLRATVSGRTLGAPPESLGAPELGGGRLLVVEDDLDARSALAILLEDWGFEVIAAGSGEEALAVFDPGVRVALLDVELPGCSGLDVERDLRRRRADLPVIFLSGSERSVADPSPLVRHLMKPVDLDALESSLRTLLAAASPCEDGRARKVEALR